MIKVMRHFINVVKYLYKNVLMSKNFESDKIQ